MRKMLRLDASRLPAGGTPKKSGRDWGTFRDSKIAAYVDGHLSAA